MNQFYFLNDITQADFAIAGPNLFLLRSATKAGHRSLANSLRNYKWITKTIRNVDGRSVKPFTRKYRVKSNPSSSQIEKLKTYNITSRIDEAKLIDFARNKHSKHPLDKNAIVKANAETSEIGFNPVITPKEGTNQVRGYMIRTPDGKAYQPTLEKQAYSGQMERVYTETGPLLVAVDRGGTRPTGKIIPDISAGKESSFGPDWTAHLYGMSGKWKWVSGERELALTKVNKKSSQLTPAIISVSPNLKGDHFYGLQFHTGEMKSKISLLTNIDRSEPKNVVGSIGQLVLGKPIGIIKTHYGEHPLYDSIQVRPKLNAKDPNVVRTY